MMIKAFLIYIGSSTTCTYIYLEVYNLGFYMPYEGSTPFNQKDRKLNAYDRKLEENHSIQTLLF